VLGRPGSGLANARIEAEIADHPPWRRKAPDVADRCTERRRRDHVHARHAHQALDLRRVKHVGRDHSLDVGDLLVEEVDLAQRGVDGLALVDRQLEPLEPAPAGEPEQVLTFGFSTSRRISAPWTSFFARVRARMSWLRL
jgi:hypothetical protein